jgi:pimeloyl-ACP methyl ester carboxylesterase
MTSTTAATTIDLPFGPCDVRVSGPADGPAVLLVHGVLVDGSVWDGIVPALARTHRVIQPDLPIGAHRRPAQRREELHPEGIADALVALLDRQGADRAVVVGNDTGGAIAQILTARHPDRVAALVLTSCDAFDHFPPTVLKPVKPLLAIPAFVDLMAYAYRAERIRRSWIGAGLLLNHPIDDAVIEPWFSTVSRNRAGRADMAAFLRRCRPQLTHAAAEALRSFSGPALIAWSAGDRLFPEADGRRLAEIIPNAELALVSGARTFSPVDQPDQLAGLILQFLRRTQPVGSPTASTPRPSRASASGATP